MHAKEEVEQLAAKQDMGQAIWQRRLALMNYLVTKRGFNVPLFWGTILPSDVRKAKTVLTVDGISTTVWIRHWPKMSVINDTLFTATPSESTEPTSSEVIPTSDTSLELPPL
jgi:hypothetical protein